MARPSTEPPLFDLGDPAVRWDQTDRGFLLERRFHPRTLLLPVGLVLFGALGLWGTIQDGNWFAAAIVALALLLWCGYLLIRIRLHDTLLLGRQSVQWEQRWPRPFTGSWQRSDIQGVRVVYDRAPKWHRRIHVGIEILHDDTWVLIGSASTYGMAPARRRTEQLAHDLALAIGRGAETVVGIQ